MTDPFTGTNQALITDLQTQSQSSPYIVVFEVYLQDSNIGGAGVDKLYFHDGLNGTNDIQWYSLDDETKFGSTTTGDYSLQTYTALPMESEGWEVRGTGTLPRPTIRMANVNSYWAGYLTDFDDLVGAKIIRRRTLAKYIYGGSAVSIIPVEFNRDVFYIERKVTETAILIEFELTSAFDVQGIKLPRRSIIAARCPWKYKDTDQGGCNWPADNVYGGNTLYFDKDDNRITLDAASPGTYEYTYWGRQEIAGNRTGNLYAAASYSIGDYVQHQRPVGSLYKVLELDYASNITTLRLASSGIAGTFTAGEYVIIKGISTASANHKNVPLYVLGNSGDEITVQTDGSHTASIEDDANTATIGYIQVCRSTLFKCTVAHSITTGDSIDDLIKPNNISYWDFGDVCGKRLNSCAIRFGHVPATGVVDLVHVKDLNGVLQQGDGYSAAPAVTFARATGGGEPDDTTGTGASATAVLGTTSGLTDKVVTFTDIVGGSLYTRNPTVTIAAATGSGTQVTALAEARVKHQATDNVNLPFGGFPGASLY